MDFLESLRVWYVLWLLFVVYSEKDGAQFVQYFGCNICDLVKTASLYIDRIYALDKYLYKIRKKDFEAIWLLSRLIYSMWAFLYVLDWVTVKVMCLRQETDEVSITGMSPVADAFSIALQVWLWMLVVIYQIVRKEKRLKIANFNIRSVGGDSLYTWQLICTIL